VVYGVSMLAIVLGAKLLFLTAGYLALVGMGDWLTFLAWRRLPDSPCGGEQSVDAAVSPHRAQRRSSRQRESSIVKEVLRLVRGKSHSDNRR
jgi:hypothetical protein